MDLLLCIISAAIAAAALSAIVVDRLHRRELFGSKLFARRRSGSIVVDISEALGEIAVRRAGRLAARLASDRMRRRLAAAGLKGRRVAAGFAMVRIAACIVFALLGAFAFETRPCSGAACGAAAGWALMELWARGRARSRSESIERDLPFALDMLTLCVEAGLDLVQAISRVASKSSGGELAAELRRVDSEIRVGTKRSDALRGMQERLGVPSVATLVALLVQSERLGSGVAPVLRATSERVREARFARAERRGAIAAQKMLLPLVLLIMPATFIIVFGPLFVRLCTGGVEALF